MEKPEFTTDKIPPQDLLVERKVLASILYNAALLPMALSSLAPTDFYNSMHEKIFRAMADTKSVVPEILLHSMNGNADEGMKALLEALIFDSATSPGIDHLVKILKDVSARRRLIEQNEISNAAYYNLEMPVVEITGRAEQFQKKILGEVSDKTFWYPAESRVLITRMLTTEPEPFNFVVPGLLPKGVCGFLYGEGGSYKSLAALWLGVQRAAGFVANSKWLDRFEITGPAGRSMFCSVEDQQVDIHHRVKAIVDRFAEMRSDVSRESIVDAVSENFHVFPRERWMQDGFEHIIDADGKPTVKTDLVSQYAKDQDIDLIVLDTLSRLSLVDENDNNGGARLVSALERIRDDTGAAVLVIAHSGKIGRQGKTDTHGQNAMRGASALMDNARFGLWFRSLPSKGGPAKLEILNAKTFRAMRAEPFEVTVDYPAFTLCEDVDTEDDLMDAVVADVRANPGTTQHGTRKRLKKKQTIISQAYRDAMEECLIICKGGRGKKGGYLIA